MIVQKPRLILDEDRARISTTVLSESERFSPFELVLGFPSAYVGWFDLTGNPYVPTLLLLAGILQERLRLEGGVSPLLLSNASKASALYSSWWGLAPISVEAEALAAQGHPGDGCGLFFTRGVDSWFSALRDRTGKHPAHVTHLLYAPDLDRQYSQGTRRRALERTREAADRLSLPLIPVSHNIRELLDPFVRWERVFGGVLAGIGLALGGWFGNVLWASSLDSERLIPSGSHPELNPLWSTERTTFHLDALEVTRTEKVNALAASDLAISRLKVCWREDIDANCGRCEKCLRTQCALAIAGALDRAPGFLHPLTPQLIGDLPPFTESTSTKEQLGFWRELCESFPDDPRLADLKSAAIGRLQANPAVLTAQPKAGSPPFILEAPPGAAVSLMPAAVSGRLPALADSSEERTELDANVPRVEITWTAAAPGRIPFPLRPPALMSLEILEACRDAADRPVPWCLVGHASPETARLMERLTESWGQGITCLSPSDHAEGDHGIPRDESALIQRFSETRVWYGDSEYLDPFLVLEALRHGCLPLQCVPMASHDALVTHLPPGLAQFTLAIPENGPIPLISDRERTARIEQGLSVLLAGTMERDLAEILPSHASNLE